jgi:hypothetical protein
MPYDQTSLQAMRSNQDLRTVYIFADINNCIRKRYNFHSKRFLLLKNNYTQSFLQLFKKYLTYPKRKDAIQNTLGQVYIKVWQYCCGKCLTAIGQQ